MGYTHYSKFTFSHTLVPSDQTDFPLVILLNDNRFRSIGNGGHGADANGFGFRPCTDATGVTQFTFELVSTSYNATTGVAEIWIKIPNLSSTVDTDIYLFYGDATITTDGSSTSTWPSQYKLVAHLPNGSSLTVNDSTSNARNLTNHSATATAGLIGGAAAFNGTSQYMDIPAFTHSTTVNTISGRFTTTDVTQEQRVYARGNSGSAETGNDFTLQIFSSVVRGIVAGDGGSGIIVGSSTSISNNTSYVFQLVFNGATLKLYLNGSQVSSDAAVVTIAASTNENYAGARNSGGSIASYLKGTLDELRDSNIAPTADWITTEHNNQSAPIIPGTEVALSIINFDAASNSGDQAASANYTFNRTCSGADRFLLVSVELLTVTGATVTSVTDDDGAGNIPLIFIGAKSTITGAGRVEMWGLPVPATGTKAIRVILSASIESVATAISYTGVNQTTPTEAFNSAQATNAGSATNASVAITSVTDQCWIAAACVANDTSIVAGQTSRNNVSGTLGSGADEDNNGPISPAGATTMTFTGMGITATWAIVGVAIKPYLGDEDVLMAQVLT